MRRSMAIFDLLPWSRVLVVRLGSPSVNGKLRSKSGSGPKDWWVSHQLKLDHFPVVPGVHCTSCLIGNALSSDPIPSVNV